MNGTLPWLTEAQALPPPEQAWPGDSPAPGLLAAGGGLSVQRLLEAYAQGCFPWFSEGQPVLWWSPDPRMVLPTAGFRLHRSLRKTLQRFRATEGCELRVDSDFPAVIRACARAPRAGQAGTWIVPEMVQAYERLHAAGHAHSVETWVDGSLVGGLYCVAIGRAVFGESMFAHATDASKIALAALVAIARRGGVELIDCQQNTRHLASLGAREVPRAEFLCHVAAARTEEPPAWRFAPQDWEAVLGAPAASPARPPGA
ncbi:leucyl/phenylalanyl-tRNA--protein transferase [Melaminivora alkalimesophila]|uniref:Leucyl/phenylalanyl-tRNA--protein transferase n=1 Tax=Melaminivora alkalimesophila TaxID=1165852 RepID=A0A317RCJ3_9BURK|nr:leucyl/phenylalanyl-tRNA--protein transferase [Melaminivora alkalimesophila]PWW43636.1 leucyl/phenylalanyl-tRNA--protein transferase [Melaminivora alkalimesophila]